MSTTITIKVRKLKRMLHPDKNRVKKRKVNSVVTDQTITSTIADEVEELGQTQVLDVESIKPTDSSMSIIFPANVLESLVFNSQTNLITDLKLNALENIDPVRYKSVIAKIEKIKQTGPILDVNGFVTTKVFNIVKNAYQTSSLKFENELRSFLYQKLNTFFPTCKILIYDNSNTDVCGQTEFTVKNQLTNNITSLFDNLSVVALGGDSLDASAPGLSGGEYFNAVLLFERFHPLTLTFESYTSQPGQFVALGLQDVKTATPGTPQIKI